MPEPYLAEKNLEDEIEKYLTTCGGYTKGNRNLFDPKLGLDPTTLLEFIKTTQPKEWQKYQTIYGDKCEVKFIERVNQVIHQEGLLKVLRSNTGIKDRGCTFKLAFWKPETSMNEDTARLYDQNILHCTRQLYYSANNKKSLDIVLFLNGIPVVTMELKNQFTGQSADNAVRQYKFDREPNAPIFTFKERVLVHFAVDLYDVKMTTRLEGAKTFFLPFNQGSNGPGNTGGKGNPVSFDGDFVTAYLWREVLVKDSLMDLIHKFMHLEVKDNKKERMIFPRYHQLDVVRKLIADAKVHGAGRNYLVQHSAGSGKSNSIAWLAYRLASLHNDNDEKIFKSVIVVTDRKILDSQLQDTIYQFDHVDGVVVKVDQNSKQLLEAINEDKPIIITTLQKFPVIYKEVDKKNRNFAVIVDEAHSSQSGESAKKLKKALGVTEEEQLREFADAEAKEELKTKDEQDKLTAELESHGQRENLSFFAFTATPKPKTLNLFGTRQQDGSYKPFHVYSMRQAIDEGFILDVLQNYMTYSMYYRILKDTVDDPDVNATEGMKAIKNYQSLHPHNLRQKTQIIVEQFLNQTRHQIGGRAKAMVVTSSRLHAVRYYWHFKKYIEEKNYKDIDVLVAFSGAVKDGDEEWMEEKINKTKDGKTIKEKQLPKEFEDNFNVLIVAEKYQTGFDQPLLHTMFVDKKLHGIKAVQTLSRLNRTMPGKESTFVLDFVNSAEDIQIAFQPYFEVTNLSREVDPNKLYDLKSQLDEFRVYYNNEIERFAEIFFSVTEEQEKALLAELSSLLKPAMDRYNALETEKKEDFRSLLNNYVRQYSFVTQVFRLFDADLEKFYRYAWYLLKVLPRRERQGLDITDKLLMKYYRLAKTFTGSISLMPSGGTTLDPPSGGLPKKKDDKEKLSELLDRLNQKYGTEFNNMDLVVTQFTRRFENDDHLKNLAQNNNLEIFATIFAKKFEEGLLDEAYITQDLFDMLMKNEKFKADMCAIVCNEVYSKCRHAAAT